MSTKISQPVNQLGGTRMNNFAYLKNHFLIAMPQLKNSNFNRSVTYICDHNAEGAMGIVINHPMPINLGEVLEQMKITVNAPELTAKPVFFGGPIQRERGFILHRPMGVWHSSVNLTENLVITTSRDILEAMAQNEGPKDAVVFLGYAGWEPGQLEKEMLENVWLSGPADIDILFNMPFHQRRQAAADLIGVDLDLLSGDIGHA